MYKNKTQTSKCYFDNVDLSESQGTWCDNIEQLNYILLKAEF